MDSPVCVVTSKKMGNATAISSLSFEVCVFVEQLQAGLVSYRRVSLLESC